MQIKFWIATEYYSWIFLMQMSLHSTILYTNATVEFLVEKFHANEMVVISTVFNYFYI